MLNWKIVCWSLGLSASLSYVICVLWGLVTPEALHMHAFLEQVLPGFKWLTWWGFLVGWSRVSYGGSTWESSMCRSITFLPNGGVTVLSGDPILY